MRRLLPLLLALALAVGAPPALAQDAEDQGGIGIRLLDAPSDRKDDPRARIYIVDHLQQGDVIDRRVEVSNTTDAERQITVYAAAASLRDGRFDFESGRTGNELTEWTTVTPRRVTLPPGGREAVNVNVTVPEDAVDGERYAVIWAELPPSGGQASVVNRVGVRMYVSVGEGAEPVTDFRIDTLTASRDEEGRPLVRTTVTNTGGRAIDLSGTLQLDDGPGSLSAGPFNVEVGTTLAPGDRAPALVRLDRDLPDGPWKATVTIRSGSIEKDAEATITFPSEAGTSAEPVTAESVQQQRRILIPVAVVLIGLLLLGLLAHALAHRPRGSATAGD